MPLLIRNLFFFLFLSSLALSGNGGERPDPGGDPLQRGFQLLHEGKVEAAIEMFERILEEEPTNPAAHYGKASSLFKRESFETTLEVLDDMLGRNAEDLNALNLRAITYYNLHRFEEAVADFERASELDPEEGYFHECLSWAYLCLGKPEAASRAALRANTLYQQSGENPSFSLLVAYLGFRMSEDEREAIKVLRYASDAMDPVDWPFPIVDYFRGSIDEDGLIIEVDTLPQETEARTYIAVKKMLDHDRETARRNLLWVVKRGNPEVFEHTYAQVLYSQLSGDEDGKGLR